MQSTNWIFLLQIFLVSLAWILSRQFYRNYELFNKKELEIRIPYFPKLSRLIESGIQHEGVFYYVAFILIILPVFLSGIFGGFTLLFVIVSGSLHEFGNILENRHWGEQVIICVGLIFFYYGAKIWWNNEKLKSFLTSKKEESRYSTKNILQKISDIDASKIPTYPRFTMYDMGSEDDRARQIIFDSSDFTIINEAFGVFGSFYGNTLLNEKIIELNGVKYVIDKVQVDFLNVFDDYSANLFGGKHTEVYRGKDVPYNIQIIIEARISELKF